MRHDQAAGDVLARAFFTDPVFVWALPDERDRRRLGPFFTGMVRWGRRFGQVEISGPEEQPTAVAIWGTQPASFVEHIRAGLVAPTVGLGATALLRFLRLGLELERWHARLCPEPHVYLYFLGVDPAHQGKGLGSALIAPKLRDADRRGLPCYLETVTENNVRFYARLDFSTAYEGQVLPPAPRFWLLKRAARST